mmetsp:Transcript_55687/g.172602  ORF Transcript_55687/g.172602 Transcript_55687/m.172602 type:complete len:117 (-) Transcript_55687:96-446(-)
MTRYHLSFQDSPNANDNAGFKCPPDTAEVAYIATITQKEMDVGIQVRLPVMVLHPTVKTTKKVPTNSATYGAMASAYEMSFSCAGEGGASGAAPQGDSPGPATDIGREVDMNRQVP